MVTTRLETSTPEPATDLVALLWPSLALLAGAGIFVFRPVAMTWKVDPNYAFGWWIPLVALFLFAERWPTRPACEAKERKLLLAPAIAVWGLAFLAFRLAAESDPDWRPGLWILVGLYVATLLGWLWLYGGFPWLRHFAFPVCFLFLSLPWFYQVEAPLTQNLMRWNTVLVADSLRMLAIAAQPAGNIIELQNCQLGVEEACSGILSFQAALMVGCLLGEIYRLTFRCRLLLILGSLLFALTGNYLRTFFLALMAFYNGADAVGRWHDTAGFSILIFTAVSSWLVAFALKGKTVPAVNVPSVAERKDRGPGRIRLAQRLAMAVFMSVLLAEMATQAWFGWRESALARHQEWTMKLPKTDSFQALTMSDFTRQALRCDADQEGQWRDAKGWKWTAYWLQYQPKPYNRIVLGWHIPDNCLPSVGWKKDRDYPGFAVRVNGLDFYVKPKRFLAGDSPVYLFWLVYPLRGDLPPDTDTRISLPFAQKLRLHLQQVWDGYRGVGVETLEVAVEEAPDYESARTGYLDALKAMAVPAGSAGTLAVGMGR